MKGAAAPTFIAASLDQQLVRECTAMASFALASGLPVPPAVLRSLEPLPAPGPAAPAPASEQEGMSRAYDWGGLARAHGQLAQLIAPATPRAVLLLAERSDARGAWSPLGPVRLVRHMLLLALASLAAFIGLALSPDVNHGGGDIFTTAGLPLLLNELFFLAAASLGAAFAALFKANVYVASATYDPKYESSYWVRYTLGLIAGILLAGLIPVSQGGAGPPLTRPLLALLGGFSSAILYGVLDRLTQTVESMVKVTAGASVTTQELAARRSVAERAGQERLDLATELRRLQVQVAGGSEPRTLEEELGHMLSAVMPAGPPPLGAAGNGPAAPPATAGAGAPERSPDQRRTLEPQPEAQGNPPRGM